MRVDVVLPDLGDDAVQDVTVSAWLVEKGARLVEGDDLLEITTDKAAFCVPCPRDGTLAECAVVEGDVIHVGDVFGALEV
ncbi:MAG: biotin/lipoyl-containing protein [Candidatus Hydrogenedentes bacterium]|jgi:pyruvate/2-oxoglutarate dehydrogenase complex dihydrolipoamide acyltransferase (E2) component|nr:biotin/lipoyl-containing protein [Candidatus Hydrogenedentota bacterium]